MNHMETSLHRALKDLYGAASGGRSEVVLGGYRVDAVRAGGALVEIQSGPLGPLRGKLSRLLPDHRIRVVKPVVVRKRVVRRSRIVGGRVLSTRRSPKRGAVVDLFEDLVGLARTFPHPNLTIEALSVSIDEIRVPRWRWPGYSVADRYLDEIVDAHLIRQPADLWKLLPNQHDWSAGFTTTDIARQIDRPMWLAQRVAYCLRLAGAVEHIGKQGNQRIYVKAETPIPAGESRS